MKYTDPKEVLNLAKNIGTDMKDMAQLCSDLHNDLIRLEDTFHDDEIDSINDVLTQIETIISGNMEETKTVLQALISFANRLIDIKAGK